MTRRRQFWWGMLVATMLLSWVGVFLAMDAISTANAYLRPGTLWFSPEAAKSLRFQLWLGVGITALNLLVGGRALLILFRAPLAHVFRRAGV